MRYPASILALLSPRGSAPAWLLVAAIVVATALAFGLSAWLLRFLLLAAAAWFASVLLEARRWLPSPLGLASLVAIVCAISMAAAAAATTAVALLEAAAGGRPRSLAFDAACAAAFTLLMLGAPLATRIVAERRRQEEQARQHTRLEREQLLRERAEMELKALQAQIEPHFLYNTLANVQHLVRKAPHDADTMLGSLIEYLRSSLPSIRAGDSTVGEELARVEAYLAIMGVRMGPRLRFEIAVPEALRTRALAPLSLMTLVENAVKHGIEPKPAGGTIRITAGETREGWELRVADDGRGFAGETAGGIGLANLRGRIRSLHGPAARLELQPRDPEGVEACLCLPHP